MTAASAQYFEKKAPGYLAACGRGLWGRVKAAEWRALRDCLELEPGLDVLDAGCGPGYYSLRMRGTAAVSLLGVDCSPAMLAAYRAQGFEGRLAAVETFHTEKLFDRVLLAGVLEFCAEPRAALANLAGLLRPGGRLVCLVPAAGLAGAAYRLAHRLRGCPAFIRSEPEYLDLARGCGLEPLKLVKASPISRVFALRREKP